MRSTSTKTANNQPTDDRTTKARIRDAAIESIAKNGVAGTTARKVAIAANISPGLVIHHYGSMDGLRTACDEYITKVVKEQKQETLNAGANVDVMAAIRNSKISSLGSYMARVLVDDSPAANKLVDDLVADAEQYMQQGVESGTLQPSENPKHRAVILAMWQMGALVMHRHLDRHMGVDIASPTLGTDTNVASYFNSLLEILGTGIYTESVATELRQKITNSVTNTPPE